jgi:cytochrome c5
VIASLALVAVALVAQAALPDGPGAPVVKARCLTCHEADLITAQRLSRTGWTREIDKMIRWGAQVPDTDRDSLTTYLATRFAPVPVASHARAAEGEAVYKRACIVCHDGDLIEQQRLSRPAWVREVDKMIRWGAPVADADKDALVDYLATSRIPGTR